MRRDNAGLKELSRKVLELIITMGKTTYSQVANRVIAELREHPNQIDTADDDQDIVDQFCIAEENIEDP